MDSASAESEARTQPTSSAPSPVISLTEEQLARLIGQAVSQGVRAALDERSRTPLTSPLPVLDQGRRVATAVVEKEEEVKQAERERQRYVVRNSRASVSNLANEAVHITFNEAPLAVTSHSSPQPTPFRSRVPVQTKAAFERRLSGGHTQDEPHTPVAAAATAESAAAAAAAAAVAAAASQSPIEMNGMSRDEFHRYESTSKAIKASVDKFYGERELDKDRTVHEFVRLINAEMDSWLGEGQQRGRLNLVIGRTGNTAQNWLVDKRDELKKLWKAKAVTEPDLMEWGEIQEQFVAEMSKGITSAVYELQLKALKIRDSNGRLDVAGFIRSFDRICARLYPSSQFTSESDRRRRLGEKFEERLRYCGEGPRLKDECLRMLIARGVAEKDRVVDTWQEVLREVASMDEFLSSTKPAASGPAKERGQHKKQSPWLPKQSVSAIAEPQPGTASDEEDRAQSDEGRPEGAQTAAAAVAKSRAKLNPYLSPEQVRLLRAKKPMVCLLCYKADGHYSSDCKQPANRPPTEAELK